MGKGGQSRVELLGPDDVAGVVSVLSESFFDYPVMRYVLGAEPDYSRRLDRLVGFFVMARVLREEVLLGVRDPNGLKATALVSYPGRGSSPPQLGALREETWAHLGAEARSRYESYGAAASRFTVDAEHIHLNMIGVRRSAQGQGLARVVLDAVHELSVSDETATGVSLNTELESNLSLYEHFGYEVIGSTNVESTFTTWGMFRRDR